MISTVIIRKRLSPRVKEDKDIKWLSMGLLLITVFCGVEIYVGVSI